ALFDNYGVTLPLPTRILIAASAVITQYWWAILIALVAFGWGTARFLKTERGKALRDRVELKVPLWRVLHRKMMLERFTQTLSTMIKSGVELKDALVVSSQVMENRVFVAAMERVIFDVQNRGLPLAAAMRREDLFPEDLCQMVAIGEETASLDAMLDNIASRLSREVVAISDAATAMLEPVMILVMGAGVAFIVISILLPMLQMNQLVG
ncbi:MAG: type II secretion system F family protein, partial [bacterium]